MSENKNIQSLSTKERIGVGLGAAAIGVMVAGGVSTANSIEHVNVSHETISPTYDKTSIDTSINLEPVHANTDREATSSEHAPVYKGRVTIINKAPEDVETSITIPPIMTDNTIPEFLPENNLIVNTLVQPNLDKAHLTESDYKYASDNTVFLDFKDGYCSGSLINDTNGNPVGVRTAEHCYLQDNNITSRIQGSDGKTYIVKSSAVKVEKGSFKPVFKTVGNINEFYLPNSNDRSMDLAIGALEGHSMDEVMAAFSSTALSAEDINNLKAGTKATLSGYPALQKNNLNPDYLRRQDFPMVILGVTKADPNKIAAVNDWNEDILWTAVPLSKDGASCSYGNSGGEGTVILDGKRMSLGVLSRFIPFTTDFNGSTYSISPDKILEVKNSFENAFGIDLTGVAAICGFSNKVPDANNPGTTVEVVSSYNEIPIQHETLTQEVPAIAEPLIKKAHDEFFDPNYVKTWVRGAINLDPNGKGYWKMNPVVFYDKESGSAIIGSYTDNAKDGLELDFIPDFKNQKFYGYAELFNTDGEIEMFNGVYGYNGFSGKNAGYIFGQKMEDKNAIEYVQNDPQFSLYFDDSTQSLQIMQYK